MANRLRKLAILGAASAAFASAAWAFPWDIDMVDGVFLRAFKWKMMGVPEGAVSQNRYRPAPSRMDPEINLLSTPFAVDDQSLATGKRMFVVYCQTCHGVDGLGGAPVVDNTNGTRRYPIPPPNLSGDAAITKVRSDGYIYLTMRNGGSIMPSYATSMSAEEMWAVVAYIRTLPGAQKQ